ncbi:ORF6N domain-containing protein [Lysinibacillus sp. Ag94]|uniref:ORF6N domain-containing protein n=1 Tax=Lysinibacillus sp. Ag94 TaxID=2936682 RepID=UPI00200D4842|nr:ORF6N domain-containing protein [Lysinibacillus sp. Ag94]UPW82364.1 ORF6N domain-containing protein [Lysinibacillus sp. Ag94]
MNPLQIIVHDNRRVLTTTQIAESYETENKVISNNFNRNKDRYKEGKHYIALTGESKREFLNLHQIEDGSKNAQILYLWTEKGAWLHAKSLNTDKAWDAYEMLVDEYYTVKDNVVPLSKDQALVTVLRTTADLVEDTQAIKNEQHEIRKELSLISEKVEEQITLTSGEQRAVQKEVAKKVYSIEDDTTIRPKLFKELHREIKDRFAVASYKDVRRQELQIVINYIRSWVPRKVS